MSTLERRGPGILLTAASLFVCAVAACGQSPDETLPAKTDEVLIQQLTEWRGKIAAAVQQLNYVEQAPGDPLGRAAVLANALQSLEEGRQTGLLQLVNYLKCHVGPERGWRQQLWAGGLLNMNVPSEQQTAILDRAQEDIEWLYVANVASARIHQLSDREILAREALPRFARATASVLDDCKARYTFAEYSSKREHFWEVQIVALRALTEPRPISIAVEFEEQEIEQLKAET
jgi:hypothetical protein